MNRALYIIGIVFSIVFIGIIGYYSGEVSKARFDYMFSDFSFDSYGVDFSSYGDYKGLTVTAALWSLFFFLFFITTDLLGLIKVKRKTTRVLSIIGLSISGLFLFWNFLVMFSPGGITFDEVSPAWILYCFIMLAFMIIGVVQSVSFAKNGASIIKEKKQVEDLLDL